MTRTRQAYFDARCILVDLLIIGVIISVSTFHSIARAVDSRASR